MTIPMCWINISAAEPKTKPGKIQATRFKLLGVPLVITGCLEQKRVESDVRSTIKSVYGIYF